MSARPEGDHGQSDLRSRMEYAQLAGRVARVANDRRQEAIALDRLGAMRVSSSANRGARRAQV